MILTVRTIGILFLALAAGCVGVKEASSRSEMNEGATVAPVAELHAEASAPAPVVEQPVKDEEPPVVAEPAAPVAVPAEVSAPAPVVEQPLKDEEPPAVAEPAAPVAVPAEVSAPAPVDEQPLQDEKPAAVAEPAAPVVVPAESSAPPVVSEQPPKSAGPAPVTGTPEPTLDVEALKTRLRDTKAIGVFTKLALKNQVDDLLEQFRERHRRGPNANVAELRQPYNMLILKVLALVQDSDPSLARTISGSREAIWGILADREKFNSLARLKEAPLDQT